MPSPRCLFLPLLLIATACRAHEPRVLSLTPIPRSSPPPASAEAKREVFLEAVRLAREAGAGGLYQAWSWQALEPSPGRYDLDNFASTLSYLGQTRGLSMLLTIHVVNTSVREIPADLHALPFDSPRMKQRFRALFDALLPHLDRHVLYLSIGNEVDEYLSRSQEWAAYQSFYEDAAAHVRARAPWLKVGVTSTFDGARLKCPREVAALNAASDVFILTYYAVDERFLPEASRSPLDDLPRAVALAGGRPLVLQEVGYPSSEALPSSEQHQADFISSVFAAWHSTANIPYLNFSLMHDYGRAHCSTLPRFYGLPGDARFEAFLCSIGLRDSNGRPKLGWFALEHEAAAAGFLRAPQPEPARMLR
jgi:hypothetical protein